MEAVDGSIDAASIAQAFARRYRCVAAVTGPADVITDGNQLFRVHNGHPLMARVTGTGCMATSVVAAFSAVEQDSALATAAALACYGLAGERAAERASGPGTFHMHLFDALAALDENAVRAGARIHQEATPPLNCP